MINLTKTQKLAQALIQRASVTPDDKGCQDIIEDLLKKASFNTVRLNSNGVTNLLALHGAASPFLLFLGHTDVVPAGNTEEWIHDPFDGFLEDLGDDVILHGRGTQDMKGSDAAMCMALCQFVVQNPNHKGTVGLLLTSNEEGDAVGGTPFVVEYLKEHNLIPDYCIVGEPSCSKEFGDTIKNGRRGSITAHITVKGVQGHVAYPDRCDNAAHHAGALIKVLSETQWDKGSQFFPKSSFQVTNISCGTGAENVVPGSCYIMCNWRYSDLLNKELIERKVTSIVKDLKLDCDIRYVVNGLPFVTKGGELLDVLKEAISLHTKVNPSLSTAGGTSDGRFIAPLGTKVVEFGPLSTHIHKVNEAVSLNSLEKLKDIFVTTLEKLF